MTRVVVTDHAFTDLERERAAAERAGAEFSEHRCRTEAETVEAVAGADVALVNFAPVTAAVLRAMAPGATVVRYGVGVDNVDLDAARAAGVAVANVPDYGSETVADHATACLLALLRKLPRFDRAVREHGWVDPASLAPLPGSRSTTVGLVGTGRIGSAVADRLAPFGFTVLAHDPYADPLALAARGIGAVGFEELLERSHAISLHLPLTGATRHLLDAAAFARLRPGAVLVNTARGGLVDTDALVEALSSGRLGGAALDVTDPEPLPAHSPLRRLPGVLLTPHAAYFSDDSVADLQRLAAEETARALAGEPLRCRVA
ncbi:C-terminal binding protein [Kineococcus gypseus]|uniref:C-terminal binding protein n=1 Tax=Kineococcus gypseus TaxID=1637102 RepID=UPI003D7CF284